MKTIPEFKARPSHELKQEQHKQRLKQFLIEGLGLTLYTFAGVYILLGAAGLL